MTWTIRGKPHDPGVRAIGACARAAGGISLSGLGRLWVPFLLLMATTGCDRGGIVPVKGTVKLDGKLLAHASVTFIAQDEGGKDATGTTDENGVFHLSTFKPRDGAMRGKYKVIIQPAAVVEGGTALSQEEAMQGGAITAKKQTVRIAARFSQPDQAVLVQVVPGNGDMVLDVSSE